MSKVQAMRAAIGDEAFRALGFAGVVRVGAVVVLADEATMDVLRVHGVIGKRDGLTLVGSILAEMARGAVEDAMF
jgi:hypothetical protein